MKANNLISTVTVFFLLAVFSDAMSQTTSSTGLWTTGSNWVGSSSPSTTINSENITINNRIIHTGDLTFQMNGNSVLTVNDTLIVDGDFIYQSNAGNHTLNINGMLIVTGNVNNAATINVDKVNNDGVFIVGGNLSYKGGNPKGSTDSEFYVNGTVTPPYSDSRWTNGGSPGSGTGGVQGEFDELEINHPGLCIILNFDCSTLSADFNDFSVTLIDGECLLEWETTNEENNDFFTIERSKDGVMWEGIIKENGVGNSESLHNYNVIDEKPYEGTSHYRLKQTDFDGEFTYSSIKSIDNIVNNYEVSVYPNPATEEIYIKGSELEIENIQIFDALGKEMSSQIENMGNQGNTVKLDLSSLKNGVYYVKTVSGSSIFYKK